MLSSEYRAVLLPKLCSEMNGEYSDVLSSGEPFFIQCLGVHTATEDFVTVVEFAHQQMHFY